MSRDPPLCAGSPVPAPTSGWWHQRSSLTGCQKCQEQHYREDGNSETTADVTLSYEPVQCNQQFTQRCGQISKPVQVSLWVLHPICQTCNCHGCGGATVLQLLWLWGVGLLYCNCYIWLWGRGSIITTAMIVGVGLLYCNCYIWSWGWDSCIVTVMVVGDNCITTAIIVGGWGFFIATPNVWWGGGALCLREVGVLH